MTADFQQRQHSIRAALEITDTFDAATEGERRICFLQQTLMDAGRRALVLGISGGVDSTVAGRLAQLAAERARAAGHDARFVAVRLPYGFQRDEADAQHALDFIRADEVLTVNIKPAADALLEQLLAAGATFASAEQQDFVLGNIKARQRMVVQYAIAGARAGLVVGTDHSAEALMGFFTKFGDGASDLVPLFGLNKRRIRAVGRWLQAPTKLVDKVPTADLESMRPQLPDEAAYGISYAEIDDFLEGKAVSDHAYQVIFRFYEGSRHKRALPLAPPCQG